MTGDNCPPSCHFRGGWLRQNTFNKYFFRDWRVLKGWSEMVHRMFSSLVPKQCLVLLVSNLAALMRDHRVMLSLREIFKRKRLDVSHDPIFFFLWSSFLWSGCIWIREKLNDYNNNTSFFLILQQHWTFTKVLFCKSSCGAIHYAVSYCL